jgi:hypothetical protein
MHRPLTGPSLPSHGARGKGLPFFLVTPAKAGVQRFFRFSPPKEELDPRFRGGDEEKKKRRRRGEEESHEKETETGRMS